jgi:hypothetical protein
MTKSAADFAQRNTERAVQVTNYGMDWVREVAEQNLDQSKASVETLVSATRKAVRALDQQTSAVLGRSMLAAEEMLSNTFDFLHKLVRMKDPQELAQLQSEFGTALFPPPAFCECRHRVLACCCIAMCRRPILMMPQGQRPHPRGPDRRSIVWQSKGRLRLGGLGNPHNESGDCSRAPLAKDMN